MGILFLGIGIIATIVFITNLFKGQKYDSMLTAVSGKEYPLKSIYSVGLSLQDTKLFALKGSIGDKLRSDATLVYGKKYSEFYARMAWAQVLSFGLFFIAFFFTFAGIIKGDESIFFAVIGLIACGISVYFFITKIKNKSAQIKADCEKEFANAVSKMALLVNSGIILHEAWVLVANGNQGTFYQLMRESCTEMQNGIPEIEAIYRFGIRSGSEEVKKFTSALIQSLERGGGDLPQFLAMQTSELWHTHRQVMLQRGEKAASALIAPIALMFAGVMLIVLSAALQSLSL